MDASNEAENATELEAMCKEDFSWHPCQISLSSTEDSLIVDFGSHELEDMVLKKDEVLRHLRFRSAPLQGDDCSHIEGEHVLATNKSQFKSHFHDAKVEKVLRVRHSQRAYCRCTFMIEWLHQDLKGQTVTVPSSSILKLARKNINNHPTVAEFLKSVQQMGFQSASPFPIMHEEFDVELDLNTMLGKHIEEINFSANGLRKEITVEALEGVKADSKGHKPFAASKLSISNSQVSHDLDQANNIAHSSGDDPQAPCSSVQEEHSEYRSRLTPLAARAALAFLVSSTHKHIAKGGTELFNSGDSDDMSIDKLSFEAIRAHNNENKTSDGIKTRSAFRKGVEIQNSDSQVKSSGEEIKLRDSTNRRRLTRSTVQKEKDKSTIANKTGLEESQSARITGSYSSEENVTTHENNALKKKNDASIHAESNIHREESNQKPMSGYAGAIQDIYDPTKACDKDTKSTVSTNMRRLTRSSRSSEESLIVPENNGMEKKRHGSRKNKTVSPSSDEDVNIPCKEINNMKISGAVTRLENIPQSEGKVSGSGKSQGQKRKSTPSRQELRCSPRLKLLPRTRSQNTS